MSTPATLYPLSIGSQVSITSASAVVGDSFESGATSTRRLWPARTFKRRIAIVHPAIKAVEMRTLREFWDARDGRFGAFWYRDNIEREGNHYVRFGSDLERSFENGARALDVSLVETAPRRSLPNLAEMTTAAGAAPLVWIDANRQRALRNNADLAVDSALWDTATAEFSLSWTAGSIDFGTSLEAAYQHIAGNATRTARTAANSSIDGTEAVTLFAIVRATNTGAQRIALALGNTAAGAAVGIQLDAANNWTPWVGASEVWTGAESANVAATWYSVAVVWPAAGSTPTLYVNAASIGTATNARNITAGPVSLLATPTGTLLGDGIDVGHAIVLARACSGAEVKAVHNLLAYQYGLAQVP